MYTPPDKAVIASLAFHPTDHVLLIATSNKLLFWSWDQPEPFACVQTASVEEKVRYMYNTGLVDVQSSWKKNHSYCKSDCTLKVMGGR